MNLYSFDEANSKYNGFINLIKDDLLHEYPLTKLCLNRGPEYEGIEEEKPDSGGGGGSGGGSTVQMQSGKDAIGKIFDFNKSYLSQQEMADLELALDELIGDYFEIRQILAQWNGTKLGFQFGELKSSESLAEFNRTSRTITFKEGQEIDPDHLLEELLHATQHNMYGEAMAQAGRNIEFEVKVFQDLINLDNGAGNGSMGIWGMDYSPSYIDSYNGFINDIIIWKNPFDINVYNELYRGWKGYQGKPSSDDFDPELIQRYF